jgi:hypothetical protein
MINWSGVITVKFFKRDALARLKSLMKDYFR